MPIISSSRDAGAGPNSALTQPLPPLHSLQNRCPQFWQTCVNLRVLFPHLQHFIRVIFAFTVFGASSKETILAAGETIADANMNLIHFTPAIEPSPDKSSECGICQAPNLRPFRFTSVICPRHRALAIVARDSGPARGWIRRIGRIEIDI